MNSSGPRPANSYSQGLAICRLLLRQHSEFFRTGVFFDTWKVLLADLQLRLAQTAGKIKIAVVGCSAGEEVYSLAMALDKASLLGKVVLFGVDGDQEILFKACSGRYDFAEYDGRLGFLSRIPAEFRDYFIISQGSDVFSVQPRIKKQVKFQLIDLLQDDCAQKLSGRDVIIVNNVLVHIPSADLEKVKGRLIASLNCRGSLIVDQEILSPGLVFSRREGIIRSYLKS